MHNQKEQIVTILTLSGEQWDEFDKALEAEPREIPAIKKLLAKKTCID